MVNRTQDVGQTVAAQTPAAGPTMKDSSTATESSEIAVRRSSSGTAAMTACRMIEKLGMTNRPASEASASSGQYPANGAIDQHTAATTIEGTTTRRSPIVSRSRPRHGPLIAIAIVAAAETRPAAAYVRPRVATTCSVSTTPPAKIGIRTRNPSSSACRMAGRDRTRR